MTPDELRAWRTALRRSLLDARLALPAAALEDYRRRIDAHLRRAFPDLGRGAIAFCWPFRNEYDARPFLAGLRRHGAVTALPAIVGRNAPLEFREWHPGIALEPGPLGIPFPPRGAAISPDTLLLPAVGFDAAGHRLGYGAGYFDRTLAAMPRRARVIGIAYEISFIPTIHPLDHDVPMDYVVTERGVYAREDARLRFLDAQARAYSSPPCEAARIAPGYFGEEQ